MGLTIDHAGLHFDPAAPSDLEQLLARDPLDDTALLDRARDAIARIREQHLSKYSATCPGADIPEPGYVLVVDQVAGDASVRASGADRARFLEMLVFAQEEHPGARVVIRTHPESRAGLRPGHFGPADAQGRVSLFDGEASPWDLLYGAVAVYTVSSQMGFEAIFAGHKPRVFGQPFYAGWGLTVDEVPVARRQRSLTRAQLFAGAMMRYPVWYDPFEDQLCELERVLDILEVQARAWRQDRFGWRASGMRLWKRPTIRAMFGQHGRLSFSDRDDPTDPRPRMVWASKADSVASQVTRVEDGFLRSRGLGAELVPPMSLIADDLGIYYAAGGESRLEHLIAQRATLRTDQRRRAEALRHRLIAAGVSKYNLGGAVPVLPEGRRILVPGQVEDDASIRYGAGAITTNRELLARARAENPGAVIVYKPHPDVEAGLRSGALEAGALADHVARNADPVALLGAVDEVWTMTSLLGFEALLRGLPVTVTGAPFYAGWGLTTDLGDVPERRRAQPDLDGLVHATLIDYPRYLDPRTGAICPVEVVVDRLATGRNHRGGPAMRLLSKLQGVFASRADLWR